MHRFWNIIIEPVLSMLEPEVVVEIGSDLGKNTVCLLEFCKNNNAVLHAVDPLPKFDVDALKKEYGRHFVFHRSLSLNAIPRIKAADVFLIDGDHNWYTVFNELKLIEKHVAAASKPLPVIMIHDIGWPYGRRDLYYNPETIPDKFRKPYKQKGIRPDSAELLDEGGLNQHLNNSIYENNLQNGVLTAVEDFVREAEHPIDLLKLPGLSGLGILVDTRLRENKDKLLTFLSDFDFDPSVREYFEAVESVRMCTELLLSEKNEETASLREQHKLQISEYGEKIADLQARMDLAISAHREEMALAISAHREETTLAIATHREEMENLGKQLRRKSDDTRNLVLWGEKVLSLCSTIINSRRWRLGNSIGNMGGRMLLRPRGPAITDRFKGVFGELENLKKRIGTNGQSADQQKKNI